MPCDPAARAIRSPSLPTAEARDALRAILHAGYPIRQLDKIEKSFVGASLMSLLRYKADPAYLDEFWTRPEAAALQRRVVQLESAVVDSTPKGRYITLVTSVPRFPAGIIGYRVRFTTGALAGEWRHVMGSMGPVLALSPLGPGVEKAAPADRFTLDNRDVLAFGEYHRYIADNAAAPRPDSVLAIIDERNRPVGKFRGKMIALFSIDDADSWVWGALRYARQVEAAGSSARFRLHIIENAPHNFTATAPWEVPWFAAVRKAMDDLMAWVERGVEPPPATRYRVSPLDQIELPATRRLGYQPVVSLTANGKPGRLEVKVGEEVEFRAVAEDPDNTLRLFEVDYEGDGKFDASAELHQRSERHAFRHVFAKPGTYFATVRVTDSTVSKGSQTQGIQNLAHVRVIVR